MDPCSASVADCRLRTLIVQAGLFAHELSMQPWQLWMGCLVLHLHHELPQWYTVQFLCQCVLTANN
jgi:hypothetical protein